MSTVLIRGMVQEFKDIATEMLYGEEHVDN